MEDDEFYVVQARPVTTLGSNGKGKVGGMNGKESGTEQVHSQKTLLKGLAASPGVACGKVNLLKESDEPGHRTEGRHPGDEYDHTGHGPGHDPGRGHRHRRGRDDLPRGHRGPRAGHSLHRRSEGGHQAPQGGNGGHRGRDQGHRYGRAWNRRRKRATMWRWCRASPSPAPRSCSTWASLTRPRNTPSFPSGVGLMRIEFLFTSFIGEHPRPDGEGQVG